MSRALNQLTALKVKNLKYIADESKKQVNGVPSIYSLIKAAQNIGG